MGTTTTLFKKSLITFVQFVFIQHIVLQKNYTTTFFIFIQFKIRKNDSSGTLSHNYAHANYHCYEVVQFRFSGVFFCLGFLFKI